MRAGHRVRQALEAELLQPGKEAGQLLPAERPENDVGGVLWAGARRQRED